MDWAKLGLLVLQEGAWEHKQIIPKDWIAAMLAPSNASPSYGYQIWLGNKNTIMRSRESPTGVDLGLERETEEYAEPVAADDVVTMRGFGFQRVWIIPSRALVIVRGGKSWPAEWDDAQIPNVIIRGILD
jgi:CubicO group peptidase (beta-lactamase class C family)